MQRILILMSLTGGGHRASALSLQAAFDEAWPGRFHSTIVDLLADYTFWPLNRSPQIYATIATKAPWLWGMAYSTERLPGITRGAMHIAARLAGRTIQAAIRRHAPDLILSVHPLAQDLTLRALHHFPRPIPFVTVVTDLASVHPLWLHPQADACYVAAEEARVAAIAAGLLPDRVHLYGLPVRPAFARPSPPAAELKRTLGMVEDLPAVLLMGGGDGVGPVEESAIALERALERALVQGAPGAAGQLVVICGRNDALRARLAAHTWRIPAHIHGFVEEMPLWMHACDAIVTKAGPGTLAEALICGLPILLNGFIPGQEEGNVRWVVEQGAGLYESEPQAIAHTIAQWFGPQAATRARMAEQARRLGRPQATQDIVSSIVALLDARASTLPM